MIYLVFESSKGRKDLVRATTSLFSAENYSEIYSMYNNKWTYKIYEVEESDDFYIEDLKPISIWKNKQRIR